MGGKKRVGAMMLVAGLLFLIGCGSGDQGAEKQSGHSGHGESHGSEQHSNHDASTKAVWAPEQAQAGAETAIRVHIQDEAGSAVEKFDVSHEKLMHLIVVSKDLAYFDHLHPKYLGGGDFEVTTTFPSGGAYKLIADYVPSGASKSTQTSWLNVEGGGATSVPLRVDPTNSKVIDGVKVALNFEQVKAGRDTKLSFVFSNAATQAPINDLEPYLGAVGHVVILSAGTDHYLHVHPVDEQAQGPEAAFMTNFPVQGIYKIWGQFQRGGKVFTVPFVVEVQE
ncbi:hypothetical protein CIG75_00965 [Tumebacillus algifaecis]|uniref:YtkA-like domain-containing protein n=1 Tax=Tumebacillus algifaecis TaxID=1214604 RepID=A0A223CWS5_9BACL|nr:hypothetical protein [Tumebacillus algifaecis]ASS73685.1 hypothetical protein CIG75_00965 [Tumebacillus algifaecis]